MNDLYPTKMILKIDSLISTVQRQIADMKNECDGIANEFDCLVSVGGGREDHAAILLTRLLPHLEGLSDFAKTCILQIKEMHADPFQRNVTN